jgi:hypothetical protein
MANKTKDGIEILTPHGYIDNVSLKQAREAVQNVKKKMKLQTLSKEFEQYAEIIITSMERDSLEQVYILAAKKDLTLFKMKLQELEKFKSDSLKTKKI